MVALNSVESLPFESHELHRITIKTAIKSQFRRRHSPAIYHEAVNDEVHFYRLYCLLLAMLGSRIYGDPNLDRNSGTLGLSKSGNRCKLERLVLQSLR